MSTRWHNLSLICGLTATVLSGCGGRSNENGSVGGSAGAPQGHGGAHSGGSNTVLGGAPGSGGRVGQGGELLGGAPGSGGVTGYGGQIPASGGAANQCVALGIEMAQAVQAAKECNPVLSSEQCTQLVSASVPCGCPTFANPKNNDAIDRLSQIQQGYAKLGCGLGVACGACWQPVRGYCSPEGRCEDSTEPEPKGCKVAGVVYPSGSTDIKDPEGSCNTCTCVDGVLSCTLRDCPSSGCPSGTEFGQGCAECGPTDACTLPEYGCFPVCTTTCADPSQLCLNGLCRGICG